MPEDTRCELWNPGRCEGNRHCPPRCPRFVDTDGTPWVVRPFEDDDWEPAVRMYETFPPSERAQGLPPATRSGIETWLGGLRDEGVNVVASGGADVVGHAVYTPAADRAPELAVFVDPAVQNRGIGTELCRQLIATAAAGGREALVLQVESRNTAAINLYRKLGFERETDRRGAGGFGSRSFPMRLSLATPEVADVQQPPAFRA